MPEIAAIETDGLSRRHGRLVALSEVNLSVASGNHVGLVGGEGAGKSTLAAILAGLTPPSSGSARIAGIDVETPQARKGVGYVPQDPGLDEACTPLELLRFAGSFYEIGPSELERRADRLLTQARLEHVREHAIEHLDAGLQRRLALAQACLHDPGVLVLDEPFQGLGGLARARFGAALDRLARQRTLLLATQDPDVVEARCERVVGLEDGRVVVDAEVPELTERGAVPHQLRLDPSDRRTAWDRLREHPAVGAVRHDDDTGPEGLEVWLSEREEAGAVLADLVQAGVEVRAFGPTASVLAAVLADRMEGIG